MLATINVLVSVLKENINILLGPFSRIVNLSFKERLHPECLKNAQVTPVH